MSISYNNNIPQPLDNPSISQGEFLTNFSGIDQWTDRDHYKFSDENAGEHRFVNLPANLDPGSVSLLQSAIYTSTGGADATSSQALFRNKNTNFLMSCVRAFGTAPGNTTYGAVPPANGFGVASVSHDNPSGTLTVTLSAGTTFGTNYVVIPGITQASSGGSPDQVVATYTISSQTVFTIKTVNVALNAVAPITSISFIVLQF